MYLFSHHPGFGLAHSFFPAPPLPHGKQILTEKLALPTMISSDPVILPESDSAAKIQIQSK
jgi:hypothetical protein